MLFKGFFKALAAGVLEGTPDVRCKLVMSGFTGAATPLAIYLSDITTIDEFDGTGYAELDCDTPTFAFDDSAFEFQLQFTSGVGSEFGATVAAGSDIIYGLLAYLYVDGNPAHDYVLGFTTDGGFGVNANNGPINFTIPAEGLMFNREAA